MINQPLRIAALPLLASLLALAALIVPLRAVDPTLQTNPDTVMDTTPSQTPLPPVPNNNTVLTFDDEFKGGALDETKWNKWYPWPVIINGEAQNYILDAFAFLPEGGLRIRADHHPFLGQKYTSGSLTTCGTFSQAYGYFEMKAKLPKGKGFWPAFWIFPPENSKQGGAEIDVMEVLTKDPNVVHMTLHSSDPATGKPAGRGVEFKGPDFTDDYHSYAVSWRPHEVIWLIDGVERSRIAGTVIPSVPEYMLVNMAMGGWGGPVDPNISFPAYMDVKYVRVYQYKDLPPVPPRALDLGKTSVTPSTVHPGESIAIQIPITAGQADLPPMLARVYVTDFYGKKYLNESDVQFPGLSAGGKSSLDGTYTIPATLPPGIYTVALKLECPTNQTLSGFVGCLSRFVIAQP
jgi:beta-glucanase (GH16 family)